MQSGRNSSSTDTFQGPTTFEPRVQSEKFWPNDIEIIRQILNFYEKIMEKKRERIFTEEYLLLKIVKEYIPL